MSEAKNENGEPFPAPRLRYSSLMPWQRPRGVATGPHRKSGVLYRLTSACPVELYFLPRSAYLLHTPLEDELQVKQGGGGVLKVCCWMIFPLSGEWKAADFRFKSSSSVRVNSHVLLSRVASLGLAAVLVFNGKRYRVVPLNL